MSVVITEVLQNSLAEKKGIRAEMVLVSINGFSINDILDYRFYITEKSLELVLISNGENKTVLIEKAEYDDIGLEFNSYLMDKQRSCKNNCIFCFVDQLPNGLRESLYFKDDDFRLSFLFGNYITLTNLDIKEVERIIKMRISPINVSVHTTNENLRVKMMKNKHAGKVLEYLQMLASNGIQLNCQLVVCKDVNDGAELKRSLNDLAKLYPNLQSIAVVPVGVTKHRDGLFEIEAFDECSANEVVKIVDEFGAEFLNKNGTRLAYLADEFYLKAKKTIPQAEYYEEFSQLENGVGLLSLLTTEFKKAVDECEKADLFVNKSVATGVGAAPYLKSMVDYMKQKWDNVHIEVYEVINNFFGETIDVAGLITGGDIVSQLRNKPLGDELFIPAVMLRREGDIFLDDMTVEEVSAALGVKITVVPVDGYEFLESIRGNK